MFIGGFPPTQGTTYEGYLFFFLVAFFFVAFFTVFLAAFFFAMKITFLSL